MKLTTNKVLICVQPLSDLIGRDLPTSVGWPLAKNIKKLNAVVEQFHEFRKKILAKYSIPGEFDANKHPKLSDESAFNLEIQDLLNQENEIDIVQIEIGKFGDCKVPPSALHAADFMFKD